MKDLPKDEIEGYAYLFLDGEFKRVKLPRFGKVTITLRDGNPVLVTREETEKLN